jgi:hypothetical protein
MARVWLVSAVGIALLGSFGCGDILVVDPGSGTGGAAGAGGGGGTTTTTGTTATSSTGTTTSTTSTTATTSTGGGGSGGEGGAACVPVDDGNPCTDEACVDGQLVHTPTQAGAACSMNGAICDGQGACVGCLSPADCPGADDECQARTCAGGVCGVLFAPAGTVLATQTIGDCRVAVCDGSGEVEDLTDNEDLPLGTGDPCTDPLCIAGAPIDPPDGWPCDDGDLCTTLDMCIGGACAGDVPMPCDAGASCVEGVCLAGVCAPPLAAFAGTMMGEAMGLTPYRTTFVVADMNGDGLPDLVSSTEDLVAYNSTGVWLNTGNLTFNGSLGGYPHNAGPYPVSVAAADLNGDGLGDVVLGNGGNWHVVTVVLNDGNPHADGVDYPVCGFVPAMRWVVTADMTGDGYPDVAATSEGDDEVSVLLNHGDGTLEARVDYDAGPVPGALIGVDLTNDGRASLAMVHATLNTVSVLLNEGGGTFAAKVDYPTGQAPNSLADADLNGDGALDLVVANEGDATVSVLFGLGDGSFAAKIDYPTGPLPRSIVALDLNGDGKVDVATASYGGTAVSILLNDGNGTFSCRVDVPTGVSPFSIAAADFDGDGRGDLVVACPGDGTKHALRNVTPVVAP